MSSDATILCIDSKVTFSYWHWVDIEIAILNKQIFYFYQGKILSWMRWKQIKYDIFIVVSMASWYVKERKQK